MKKGQIKNEIETRLMYAMPCWENKDSEEFFYLVQKEDLKRIVESISILFWQLFDEVKKK